MSIDNSNTNFTSKYFRIVLSVLLSGVLSLSVVKVSTMSTHNITNTHNSTYNIHNSTSATTNNYSNIKLHNRTTVHQRHGKIVNPFVIPFYDYIQNLSEFFLLHVKLLIMQAVHFYSNTCHIGDLGSSITNWKDKNKQFNRQRLIIQYT